MCPMFRQKPRGPAFRQTQTGDPAGSLVSSTTSWAQEAPRLCVGSRGPPRTPK